MILVPASAKAKETQVSPQSSLFYLAGGNCALFFMAPGVIIIWEESEEIHSWMEEG